jgi:hypothetical protein
MLTLELVVLTLIVIDDLELGVNKIAQTFFDLN